ncbi:MAG: hypothetical protein K8S62_10350 [Candidatus Sabulitectum sp.]|nr:hypothetical protein [Candidatus Sabulitectum sp.]
MKKFTLATAFILAVACGGAAPDKVVSEFITAWNFGEGSNVVNLMSTKALADMNGTINMLKLAPEEASSQLASRGIMFTPVEVEFLTPGEFMGGMLRNVNPSYALPDFSNAEIGETAIAEDGNTAVVNITVDGETREIRLVSEGGTWKIDEIPE